jgi:F0F1-type ATP synthase membrane subunit c/vacuolar-type H+-ATPase subunit K
LNPFSAIGSFFKKLGELIGRGLKAAVTRGLTDQIVALAVGYIRVAAEKAISNDDKRELVVKLLAGHGIPESVARFAVELGYQAIKHELDAIGVTKDSTAPSA